jgi:xanthine dehydrogenase accessory factor
MSRRILDRLLVELRDGRPAILVSVIESRGSVPRKDRPRMFFTDEGFQVGTIGGGCVDGFAHELARKLGETKGPLRDTLHLNAEAGDETGLVCGGEIVAEAERFSPEDLPRVEALANSPEETPTRLLIFGGGHVSLALARFASDTGFEVEVLDDRAKFSSVERFPFAKARTGPVADAEAWLPIGTRDAIVVATRGHQHDEEALAWAAGTHAGYLGMLSSSRKRKLILEALALRGISKDAFGDRFHAPVGLSIGAVSAEEIALAITAELIEWKNRDRE